MALPTEPQGLEPYDYIMERVLETANKGRMGEHIGQDQVEQLMNILAHHETGRTGDPSTRQKSNVYNEKKEVIGSKEGPGRGLYQYELETLGGSGAGRTAMNNLLTTYGGDYDSLPKWAKKYFDINNPSYYPNPKGDVDFSELTTEQQNILFLADKLQDVKVKLSDIGIMSDADWWSKYHHKGDSDTTGFSANRAHYLINK